jgi:hypothetical protein
MLLAKLQRAIVAVAVVIHPARPFAVRAGSGAGDHGR